MSAAVIASSLVLLALLDSAFSGYRASLGHDGLVDHRRQDREGARLGLRLGAILLVPAAAVAGLVRATGASAAGELRDGGLAMLAVVGAYGVVMAAALVAYRVLPWRPRFVASSMLLGPLSLLRTPVVALAVVAVAVTTRSPEAVTVGALGAAAVLAVEPVLTARYAKARAPRLAPPDPGRRSVSG